MEGQGEAWSGEKAKSTDKPARNPVVEAMECSICIDTMHRCTALLPCLHSMCAGCAAKALAVSDRCPSCRAPVEGAQPNLAMRGMIESFCSAEPSRKRKIEETVELDREELALAGHVERIVKQRGGNADSMRQVADSQGCTAVHVASRNGRFEVIDQLVAAGADLNKADNQGSTPLHVSARDGRLGAVSWLLAAAADVNKPDVNRTSPLFAAAQGGHLEVVEELLDAGGDPDQSDDEGSTPLLAACFEGHAAVARELVLAGANFLVDDKECSPLYVAAWHGRVHVVRELLAVGADVDEVVQFGDQGESFPLLAASGEGHLEVVRDLLLANAD
ncbi:ankyrin repeat-containing domain protein, partial [Baffinella frigidus]